MRRFAYWHELVLLALIAAVMMFAQSMEPLFVTWKVQSQLSTHIWEIAILALPMALIIVTAGIDLSIGGMMAMCAVSMGLLFQSGLSPWLAAALGLFVATICGFINGLVVTRVKVHPLIVTLATMAAFRGAAEGISRGKPVSSFPESFAWLGQGVFLGLPVPAWFFGGLLLLVALFLIGTPGGRYCYAIGMNELACRFAGVRVNRILLSLYTFSGFCSGLAAILFIARRNTAKADIGMGIELLVITAVVIGGVSIFGGRGNLLGTVLGVFLIHETREFVSWRWSKDELNFIVIGTLLIVSVLLHRWLTPSEKKQ